MPEQIQSRVLLVGDPAARPDGLERFLVRAGFQVTEAPYPPPVTDRPDQTAPDLLIFAVYAGDDKAKVAASQREVQTFMADPRYQSIKAMQSNGARGINGDILVRQGGRVDQLFKLVSTALTGNK